MSPRDLSDDELEILSALQAMTKNSTAALSAQTLMPPREVKKKVLKLKEKGLVVYREIPDSPDGDFVGLTLEGEKLLREKR